MSTQTGTASSAIATKRQTYLKHLLTQASAAADESGLGLKELRDRAIALVNERDLSPPVAKKNGASPSYPTCWRFLFSAAANGSTAGLIASSATLNEGHKLVSANGHYEKKTFIR